MSEELDFWSDEECLGCLKGKVGSVQAGEEQLEGVEVLLFPRRVHEDVIDVRECRRPTEVADDAVEEAAKDGRRCLEPHRHACILEEA